jgi:hypothetical protein
MLYCVYIDQADLISIGKGRKMLTRYLLLVSACLISTVVAAEKYEVICPSIGVDNPFTGFKQMGISPQSGWTGKASYQVTFPCHYDIRDNQMICSYHMAVHGSTVYKMTRPIPADTRCVKSNKHCRFDCNKQKKIEQFKPNLKFPKIKDLPKFQ